MNVYPVNALEAATLDSPQKQLYSSLNDLYNKYLMYQVDFNLPTAEITADWIDRIIPMDAFIIGNTNGKIAYLKLYKAGAIIHEVSIKLEMYINIHIILDEFGKHKKLEIDSFSLTVEGEENVKIGLIFVGTAWKLPAFMIRPTKSLILRNESGRTFTGQVTGVPVETLQTWAINNVRIKNDEVKKYEDYVNSVQNIIPHVIDPYPEAHEEFEPLFATILEYSEKEKRDESGFYWNFGISWMEAN